MSTKVREFIDFWIENSIHASDRIGAGGASQDVAELARRCIQMAREQGISERAINAEIGNLAEYVARKLAAANKAETTRRQHEKGGSSEG
ncbi:MULTISPECIES: hypothetical protein [unclassified Bradyrhizobium]